MQKNVRYPIGIQTFEKLIEGNYLYIDKTEYVYNPFSLLCAMATKKIDSYWFGSGTPAYLIEMMRKFNVSPSRLGSPIQTDASAFDAPTERMIDLTPLLYQSGYITIKGYDSDSELYTLDIPNREIRIGLMRSLLPNYLGTQTTAAGTTAAKMQVALLRDNVGEMLGLLREFLGTVPGVNNVNKPENYEAHWQQMLFVIFSLLGAKVDVEVHTPKGRVDMVAKSTNSLYLFELKLNKSAEAAMIQTDLKDYSERFALSGLPVIKVGINFDSDERNITDWVIG